MARFDAAAGRFRDERGRFIAERTVRDAIDELADAASERMAGLAERLQSGALSLAEFEAEARTAIRLAHTSTAMIAYGGRQQVSQANWGAVGRLVRDEYAYLRTFAADVAEGRQPLDGRLTARARLYGQAARVTHATLQARERRLRGATLARNVLGPANHCGQCKALAARGWMPIDQMVPLGSRECLSSDRCRIEYRTEAA